MNDDASRLYGDIIELPHHVSTKHPQMPKAARAAQFMPFAALTGFGAAISETARQTDGRIELSEYRQELINQALNHIAKNIKNRPTATITYFRPDEKKAGGEYVTLSGAAKKFLEFERVLILEKDIKIPIDDIIDISGLEVGETL